MRVSHISCTLNLTNPLKTHLSRLFNSKTFPPFNTHRDDDDDDTDEERRPHGVRYALKFTSSFHKSNIVNIKVTKGKIVISGDVDGGVWW